MNFAYFGRLEYEKGFDYFLNLAKASIKQKRNHNFFIFGDGEQKTEFYQLYQSNHFIDFSEAKKIDSVDLNKTNKIIYFGKRDYTKFIKPILKHYIDFTIIPSRMLETFGLSALESIICNTDIISSNQPSLKVFNLQNNFLTFDIEKDLNLIELAEKSKSEELINLQEKFSSENWINKLKQYLPDNCEKILLVSDFINKIGGTEIHIHNTKELLEKHGYQVSLFGSNKKPSLTTQLISLYNFKENKKFIQILNQTKPDLIWFHSTQRYLGNLILKSSLKHPVTKFITIHDLGLFTEYPSKITCVSEIKTQSKTIKNFLVQKPILKSIQKFDQIFVPSQYLKESLEANYNINLTVLEHFHD